MLTLNELVQVARAENKSGLFVGHVSSHAFRIQKNFTRRKDLAGPRLIVPAPRAFLDARSH